MTNNKVNSKQIVLQYVSTITNATSNCTTVIPGDDTIPQNTEGDQVLTLSITPKSSTSKLLIEYAALSGIDTVTGAAYFNLGLFQDSTANALSAGIFRNLRDLIFRYVMTSGTTSSTTFKIRIGPNQTPGNAYVNLDGTGNARMGGVEYAYMSILEIL